MVNRPNILFIMTDQHRGDSIGADPASPVDGDGRPLIHTPNLDSFIGDGAMFTRNYSPSPSSIPARRSLLTGQTAYGNGCPGWKTTPWTFETTLPGELSKAGYQTKLTGKLHSIPNRNHCGFQDIEQHEGLFDFPDDDYTKWMERESDGKFDETSHGLGRNSWDPRPWHLPEHYHPTNWTTNRALDFLDERDPTRPFFLNLSYVRPHTPFDPPQPYWDMYADRDIPGPYRGDWADEFYGEKIPTYPMAQAWVADLSPTIEHRARAGYYGLITHIDQQIKRVLDKLRIRDELEDTFILMCADHGEMLGDHYLWRKSYGYEGSARVPMLMKFHESMEADREQVIGRPTGLEDIMPTLLSVAGADVPDSVEGRNLLELVENPDRTDWREWYHGEHTPGTYDVENANQYIVDEGMKYIYYPVTGDELLFDLTTDPGETIDLSADPDDESVVEEWRGRMVEQLRGRPEGFVKNDELQTVAPETMEDEWIN